MANEFELLSAIEQIDREDAKKMANDEDAKEMANKFKRLFAIVRLSVCPAPPGRRRVGNGLWACSVYGDDRTFFIQLQRYQRQPHHRVDHGRQMDEGAFGAFGA